MTAEEALIEKIQAAITGANGEATIQPLLNAYYDEKGLPRKGEETYKVGFDDGTAFTPPKFVVGSNYDLVIEDAAGTKELLRITFRDLLVGLGMPLR